MNMSYDDFDFIGFTFNGQHSSEFNLLRISDGNRYEDTLVPNLSNETAEIPGGLGSYYWGEQIKSREFKIEIAYDNVGELEKRQIKRWLHPDDKLHELIFDEKPYVKYWVKCNREVVSKELCFNDNGKRVYKGEMTIQFIAPMPYGVVVDKNLNNYDEKQYPNKKEWAESSGLGHYPVDLEIYNPGDIESGLIITTEIEFTDTVNFAVEYYIKDKNTNNKKDNYSFKLNFNNQENPELNKFINKTVLLKSDSIKQQISYSLDQGKTWNGISGIISQGKIFNAPITEKLNQTSNLVLAHSSSDNSANVSGKFIDYTYYYI